MKKIYTLIIFILSNSFAFSQTDDITPDKILKDTLTGKTYWSWETAKAKEIAKDLEEGLINAEKVNALEKKVVLMTDRSKMCDVINDSLKLENVKANEIIVKQNQIIENDKVIISDNEDINKKNNETIQKQETKIAKKNGTIKTLIITNIVTAVMVVMIITL